MSHRRMRTAVFVPSVLVTVGSALVTPSPSSNPAADSAGSAWSTWLWLLVALALLVAFLFVRRRAAFRADLGQFRDAWRESARKQVPIVRAIAAEISRLRVSPESTAYQAAALRRRSDSAAVELERLGAAAGAPEDAALARQAAQALRSFADAAQAEVAQRTAATPPTADQHSTADAASRQAVADLNTSLRGLENLAG